MRPNARATRNRSELSQRAVGGVISPKRIERADVEATFGEPDEIVSKSERITSRRWQCSACAEIVKTDEPIPVPAPCKRCGGIAFKKA